MWFPLVCQDVLVIFCVEFYLIWCLTVLVLYNTLFPGRTLGALRASRHELLFPGNRILFLTGTGGSLALHLLSSGSASIYSYSGLGYYFGVGSYYLQVAFLMFAFLVSLVFSLRVPMGPRFYEPLLLVLLLIAGSLLLMKSANLISVYVSLELISLITYLLASDNWFSEYASEGALKYFSLGALGSSMLLLSSCLLYASYGTVDLRELGVCLMYAGSDSIGTSGVLGASIYSCLLYVGSFFLKVGVVPFHGWLPDVYEGTSSRVLLLFGTLTKCAYLIFLGGLLVFSFWALMEYFSTTICIVGIVTILVGTLFAVKQSRLRRLLAYSSIAHTGYMLVPLMLGNHYGYMFFLFYLFSYILASLGLLSVIAVLRTDRGVRIEFVSELRFLSGRNIFLALSLSILLFSMAGIPPLVGFFSKYCVLVALVDCGLYLPASAILLISVLGSFYYIYLVRTMYFDGQPTTVEWSSVGEYPAYIISLAVSGMLILPGMMDSYIMCFTGALVDACL